MAPHSLTIDTDSEAATRRLGAALGAALRPGDVIALEGDLGAGKTALTRGIAEGVGSRDRVRSPTFGLVHRYEGGRLPLVHVDAYRLSGADELFALGIETVFDAAAATVVEWAGRVRAALPKERLDIEIAHGGGDRRALAFHPRGARAEALVAAIAATR